jgi:hypothetical protein
MNYLAIYNLLVTKANNELRKKKQGIYYESHHIIPKCMGGTNDKINRVLLTPKEHYIAHRLLSIIYPDNKSIQYALWYMINGNKTHTVQRHSPSSRIYSKLREEFSIFLSNERKGQPAWNKGIKLTEDQLKVHATHQPGYKVWNAGKVTGPQSKDLIKKRSESLKGHIVSAETRKKISDAAAKKREAKPIIIKPTKAELNKLRSERMKAYPNRCRKGVIVSEETRKKISESSKNRKPISEETRNKMKAAHAKRKANTNTLIIN